MITDICKGCWGCTGNDKGNDNDKDKDKAKDNDKGKDRSRSPPVWGRRLNIVIRIRGDFTLPQRDFTGDFTVSVEASATVDDVKAQIYADKGLRHNDQMLYLPRMRDQIEDGRTLSSYNIFSRDPRKGFGVHLKEWSGVDAVLDLRLHPQWHDAQWLGDMGMTSSSSWIPASP